MSTLLAKLPTPGIASPQFLLRVGGLPFDVVEALSFDETVGWIERVLLVESSLAEKKEHLVDVLHEAVQKYKEHQGYRRKLINMKRDVFNFRPLNDPGKVKEFASFLSSPEKELLSEWADLWMQHKNLLANGPTLFDHEMLQKREYLKQVIETPDFRKGVQLSSPVLDQEIPSYLASDNLQLNRNARTVERSLIEYLLRTACKTSPFSTFTAVCPGDFDASVTAEQGDFLYQIDSLEKKSFIRLNMAVLSRLSSAILSSENVWEKLPVQMTPGWHIQHNRIRYLRRMQSAEDIDDEAPISLDIVHENVFYLPVGTLLGTILTLLGNGQKLRLGELVNKLTQTPIFEGSEEHIIPYIQQLLRLGLLIIPDLHVDIHSKYPLKSYAQGLLAIRAPETDKIAQHLLEVEALTKVYSTASIALRRETVNSIRKLLEACLVELRAPNLALPRTLVYEDTTISPQKLSANQAAWREILTNVAELQRILPIWDVNLPRRFVTRGYFCARYGVGQRCDDFLSFAYEFRQSFFEYYLQQGMRPATLPDQEDQLPRRVNYFNQPEIELLDKAQEALLHYMKQAAATLSSTQRELRLADDFLDTFLPYAPENIGSLLSHTLFSQFTRVDGEPLLVINRIYSGLTLMFSRFAHFFDEEEKHWLVAKLRETLCQLQPPGAVFAELKGGYDATNLNLHPSVTAYELVCPGDISMCPAEEQIALEDLFIQDDEKNGLLRLYSKRLGKEVIPLYLGFLMPMALPEIQQVLLNFSYATMCPLDLWQGVKLEESQEQVTFYPRLRYKNLVLQRSQWKMPATLFPQRASGQSDSDYFLTVVRWQKRLGLPTKVFVAPEMSFRNMPAPRVADAEPDQKARSYKPLYVDFENFFSVQLLEGTIRGYTGSMTISEMLPAHDQLWLRHQDQEYVAELVFEMNTVKGEAQC